jgi:DNA replication protein DnaC
MSLDNLTIHLNRLKLLGLRDTLDQRLQQAQEQQLSYREFLNLLIQDEIQRRDAKALAKRISCAKFEEEKTLEALQIALYPNKVQKMIRELASGHYLTLHQHILIMGQTGTGKSHLAQALGHHACRQGKRVLFIRATILLRTLQASRADQTWDESFKKFLQPDLLIIDDFGLKVMTATQAEDMYELIAERHLKGSILITSNRNVEGWLELFPDPVMANAALDRLSHQAHHIVLEGIESYRRKMRPRIAMDD